MGKRGTKPIPIELKEAQGTVRARDRAGEVIKPTIIQAPPDIPPGVILGEYGVQVWWNTIEYLAKYQVLSDGDLAQLARYCQAEELWQMAQKDIRANGIVVQIETNNGIIPRRNPAVDIASQQYAIIKHAVSVFGLSPADRRSIQPIEKEETGDEWGISTD